MIAYQGLSAHNVRMNLVINGKPLAFDLPKPGSTETCFVFAPPKSGSTFLNNMIAELARKALQPVVNIPSFMFTAGVTFPTATMERATEFFTQQGYCFSGFRDFPPFLARPFDVTNFKRVFMVRDPRDMLVSNYYSIRNSHPIPKKGAVKNQMDDNRTKANRLGVDDYVLGTVDYSRGVMDRLMKVYGTGSEEKLLFARYEDVVFAKFEFATRIVQHFGWNVSEELIMSASNTQNVFPEKEDQDNHIRKVTPGDFRDKLKPETIIKLNEDFRAYLEIWGYLV